MLAEVVHSVVDIAVDRMGDQRCLPISLRRSWYQIRPALERDYVWESWRRLNRCPPPYPHCGLRSVHQSVLHRPALRGRPRCPAPPLFPSVRGSGQLIVRSPSHERVLRARHAQPDQRTVGRGRVLSRDCRNRWRGCTHRRMGQSGQPESVLPFRWTVRGSLRCPQESRLV